MSPMNFAVSPGDYAFRFDAPIEPLVLSGTLTVTGWLVRRDGKPMHGIRAVARGGLRPPRNFRARRNKKRLEVAAAFPDLPDAGKSGFLLELRLGLGRSRIELQVNDEGRKWRTFHTAEVIALPLNFLEHIGFPGLRRFTHRYLRQRFIDRPGAGAARRSRPLHHASSAATPIRTRRVELFATTKSNLFILEIGELIAAGFREIGCEAQLRLDAIPSETPADDTLQMVVTPHEYYNLFLTERLRREDARRLTKSVWLLCTEQPETGWFQSNLAWAMHARGVADINPLGVDAYRERRLRCLHLQLGYHSILAHPIARPYGKRRYDITFLGSLTPRREQFFAEHAPYLAQRRCHLRFVPLDFAKTKQTRSYLTIEARNRLLSDSKILLNLHYSDQKYFEWHRMLVALANGCCIVTETCRGYGDLVPGEHFIMVDSENLIAACDYYLRRPEECAHIAANGTAFVQNALRQGAHCETFLREVELQRANAQDFERFTLEPAPGIRDAAPAPRPVEFAEMLSDEAAKQFRSALADDLRGFTRFFRRAARRRNDEPLQGMNAGEMRTAVIERRKGYQQRREAQEEARSRGESTFELYENEVFARCRDPKLSVIVTLHNYAHFIGDCVESLERAAKKLPEAPEIVIVNDGSTDDSLAIAKRSQQRSKLPIRIADKRFNTGLADARNTAVHLARGRFVFVMDADNLVFPEALHELLAAIEDGECAAAYSILCRFRQHIDHRIGLLSQFDWDPQILVQYPYIDAMAMFRREVLIELTGYSDELNQIGWFGWEDYDLWLRLAMRQLAVAFVPNILCLYRYHGTSMINTTNLFKTELVRHFLKHYGALLDGFEPRSTVFGVERHLTAEPEPCDSPLASAAQTPLSTSPSSNHSRDASVVSSQR